MVQSYYSYKKQLRESYVEPTVSLQEAAESTRKVRRKSNDKSTDEVYFDREGGEMRFKYKLEPEHAELYVEISSDFITYRTEDNDLILVAKPNPYSLERRCIVKIMNSFNPLFSQTKVVIQKGVDQK